MEHSERARYVTDQVALWISNDGDYYFRALQWAGRAEELERELTRILTRAPQWSTPWYVAQELAPSDYTRVDWKEIARQLLDD